MTRSTWTATSFFKDWFGNGPTATAVAIFAVLVAAVVVFVTLHRIVLPAAAHLAGHTAFRWDDVIIDVRLRRWSALVLTVVAVRNAEPLIPGLNEFWSEVWIRVTACIAISAGTLATSTLLMRINAVYQTHPLAKERPIKGYLQVVQIMVFVFGDIWVLAVLTDQTPWYLLSGLGAAAAVLLVLYRDTLMSLSASMQMAQNDMVRVGDWIEMPEFGANGTVIDMALATVKVRNWDNTITTIPTHRLLSESVKNWRGMAEAGTRRIQFPIHLDLSSVRFLSESELTADPGLRQNGQGAAWTNVEALQRSLVTYLQQHPSLETEGRAVMVRQLPPTPCGLPLEIYVFCRETDWQRYEAIQGDIISHALAMLDRFDLRAFQHPTDSALRYPRSRSTGPSSNPAVSTVSQPPKPKDSTATS